MSEIVITENDDVENVENVADVLTTATVAESAGLTQGIELGELKGMVQSIIARLDQLDQAETETQQKLDVLASELNDLAEAEAVEAVAEIVEAEAEAVEAETELVEAQAEAVETVAETMQEETGDEITPASRRSHWYFRPAHEWRRD